MKKITAFMQRHKYIFLTIFIALILISIVMLFFVKVNYDLSSYVPDNVASTRDLKILRDEFKDDIPNVRIYVENVNINQALEIKDKIKEVEDVQSVLWLDDVVDIKKPLDIYETKVVEGFYKDNSALYQVAVSINDTSKTMRELQEIAGENGAVSGQLIDLASAKESTSSEMQTIMFIMIPLGIILLMLSTKSYLEPIILLITIGSAVIINMGTNIFLKEVSFITQAVTGVLQLAVSMDYAIFLLHAREDYLKQGFSREDSIIYAVKKSSNSIVASASTTVLGFLSLVLMQFKIGPDLGIVLAKGVLFSFISVIFFMPILLSIFDKWLKKTEHKIILPKFHKLSKHLSKISIFFLIIIALIIPAYIYHNKINFTYGSQEYKIGSKEYRDLRKIEEKFSKNLNMAILVPRKEIYKEEALIDDLYKFEEVKSVVGYTNKVSKYIPQDILDKEQISSLIGENYSRIIVSAETSKEGKEAFKLVEDLRNTISKYYSDYHFVGENVVTYDMMKTIVKDNFVVNVLAVVSVALVILFSFRSVSIPIILVMCIEASIWINLTIPYLQSKSMNYIGYLVISTVQLGATVDYAILYTHNYLRNREKYNKIKSIEMTNIDSIRPLITPATILMISGIILERISSIEVVSQLGEVLARGAFLSFIMVITLLPALLILLDKVIRFTTLRRKHEKDN